MGGDNQLAQSSIFANELLEIYELCYHVLRSEPEVEIYMAVSGCLPINREKYFLLNFDA